MASSLFGSLVSRRPHLAKVGQGGLAGELADLRADVETAFQAFDDSPSYGTYLRTIYSVPPFGNSGDAQRLRDAFAAMAGVGEVRPLSGSFVLSSSILIPSNTILEARPSTAFVSTLAGGGTYAANVPFRTYWTLSGVGNTSVKIVNTLGTRIVRANADVASGTWVLIGDATLSACGIYKVLGSAAAGGGFDLTLDRPVWVHFAISDTILPLTGEPPKNVKLRFCGATLSGTGLRAIALLGTRDSEISGLRVVTGASSFDDHCGIEINDGCYNVRIADCIADGTGAALGGHFFANSERVVIDRCYARRFTGIGIRMNDLVDATIVDSGADNNTGTNLNITSIRGASSDSLGIRVTRFRSQGGGEGIGVDGLSRDVFFTDTIVEGSVGLGIRIYTGTNIQFRGLQTRSNVSYGMRADVDVTVQGWIADGNGSGALLNTASAVTAINGFTWGQDSPTHIYGAANVGTGKVIARNGKSTVNASSGSASFYNASTGTIIRDQVVTGGRGGYYSDAVNSMLIDRSGVDDSACTVANVFGAGAQANYGTYTANGVTGVVVNYRGMKATSQIVLSLNTVGGTPSPNYVSALTVDTSFTTKATAGDTSVMNWKDVRA